MLLQKLGGTKRPDGKMAVIELALATISTGKGEKHSQRLQSLHRWEAEPKWQQLAIMMLEKSLSPETLLMMGPHEAGAQIASILGD